MKKWIKKLWKNFINLLRRLIKEKILFWFFVWYLIFASPIIVGYTLYFFTKRAVHLSYATACLAFWSAPFTPLIPLTIACAIATKKIINAYKKRRNRLLYLF